MAFITKQQMLNSVLNELALVNGTSIQVYTEPIVYDYIQRSFDHLFSKRFWPHLTSNSLHELDGTIGIVLDSLSDIDTVSDIEWIRIEPYTEDYDVNLVREPLFNSEILCYSEIPFGQPYQEDKKIIINPNNTTGNIAIRARRKPALFEDESIIPFDSVALVHLVSASMLAIDGMNPSAQERQQSFFEDRYETLVSNEARGIISSVRRIETNTFTVA